MTTQMPCVRCTHRDHHPVEKMGHRSEPCFHKDPSQPDGFCPCRDYQEPKTAREFADAYLGPDPMASLGLPVVAPEPDAVAVVKYQQHLWDGADDRD